MHASLIEAGSNGQRSIDSGIAVTGAGPMGEPSHPLCTMFERDYSSLFFFGLRRSLL
jgi:hypothetical protein